MYISHTQRGPREYRGFQGLSDDTSDVQQLQKSLAAIRAALQLNPRTGYIKGSPPRKQLEGAFESVPQCSALELSRQLLKGEGPVEKLFRYRLARPTQGAMLEVLVRKAKECQQQQRDKLRRLEEEQRRTREESRQMMCRLLMDRDLLVAKICRLMGEGSDECRNRRSEAMKENEELRMLGIRCP
jgi:hypothetical protein